MTPFRALVVCYGDPPSAELLHREAVGADLVVCADGAATHVLAQGGRVDVVVGDMDSARIEPVVATLYSGPHEEQQNSDSEKAVLHVIAEASGRGRSGPEAVCIRMLGAVGSRLDHSLANLMLTAAYRDQAQIELVSDAWHARVLSRRHELPCPVGTRVSLIALTPDAELRTDGLAWEIRGPLELGTRGLSNEVVSSPVCIEVPRGLVALITRVEEVDRCPR